jgi:hypothetical protein
MNWTLKFLGKRRRRGANGSAVRGNLAALSADLDDHYRWLGEETGGQW